MALHNAVVEAAWLGAVGLLGGDERVARAAWVELVARYGEPHRRYHVGAHAEAVVRDSALLAEELVLPVLERAVLTVAAAAHDVVYDGQPGEDERRSAAWAREWLVRAGVDESHVDRVEALVLATITHVAPAEDLTALALLDADLASLAAEPDTYDGHCSAVRAEYAALDEPTWRAGRVAVLTGLLAREPFYATVPARRRWEDAARANLTRELRSCNAG